MVIRLWMFYLFNKTMYNAKEEQDFFTYFVHLNFKQDFKKCSYHIYIFNILLIWICLLKMFCFKYEYVINGII